MKQKGQVAAAHTFYGHLDKKKQFINNWYISNTLSRSNDNCTNKQTINLSVDIYISIERLHQLIFNI